MRIDTPRALLLALLAAGLAGPAVAGDKSGHAPHWTYKGKGGPEQWGDLSPDFKACKLGSGQTPIDLAAPRPGAGEPIAFDYQPAPLAVVNNGHTIQVNYAPGSTMSIGGKTYNLVQFHWHAPSEHTVDGKPFDMELHFVHKDAEGQLGVVGVLLRKGRASDALDSIWAHMPKAVNAVKQVANVTVDAEALLPLSGGYYHYSGSLTTPPCSEGVQWFVLKQSMEVSAAQIDKFVKMVGHNARPVQPLNGRRIELREGRVAAAN